MSNQNILTTYTDKEMNNQDEPPETIPRKNHVRMKSEKSHSQQSHQTRDHRTEKEKWSFCLFGSI